jgi:hypothetical protein
MPLRLQQLGHALAVIDVHLAAEGFDVEGLGGGDRSSRAYRRSGARIAEAPSAATISLRAALASALRSPIAAGIDRLEEVERSTGIVPGARARAWHWRRRSSPTQAMSCRAAP